MKIFRTDLKKSTKLKKTFRRKNLNRSKCIPACNFLFILIFCFPVITSCISTEINSKEIEIEKSRLKPPAWLSLDNKGLINYNGLSFVYKSSYLYDLNLGIIQFKSQKAVRAKFLLAELLNKSSKKIASEHGPISVVEDTLLGNLIKDQVEMLENTAFKIKDYYFKKVVETKNTESPKSYLYALINIEKADVLAVMAAISKKLVGVDSKKLQFLGTRLAKKDSQSILPVSLD